MALDEPRIWKLNGAQLAQEIGVTVPDPGWHVVGVGDFTGDRQCDILWRRADDTLEPRIWGLDATGRAVLDVALANPEPGWRIIAVGDFDGDGVADILWRRADGTGELRVWLLDKLQGIKQDLMLNAPAPDWHVVGVGDFTDVGKAGILWRRTDNTGEPRIWLLDDRFVVQDIGLKMPDAGWEIVGIGDFYGGGIAGILWRRIDGTGEPRIWLLDREQTVAQDIPLKMPDPGWKVIGVGKFNKDANNNQASILWRRSNGTGEVRIWVLEKTAADSLVVKDDLALGTPPRGLNVVGIGNFIRGSNDQILFGLSESCMDLSRTIAGLGTLIQDLKDRADQANNPQIEAQLRRRIRVAEEELAMAKEKSEALGCNIPP